MRSAVYVHDLNFLFNTTRATVAALGNVKERVSREVRCDDCARLLRPRKTLCFTLRDYLSVEPDRHAVETAGTFAAPFGRRGSTEEQTGGSDSSNGRWSG